MKYLHTKNISYRISENEDFQAIRNLLSECSLPVSDIEPGKQQVVVAENEGNIIGCVAFEAYGDTALFRSLAVNLNYRNLNIGQGLTVKVLDIAHGKGIREFYLLTTTADGFFKKQGWKVTDRKEVPSEIAKSSEFTSVCPYTAICMKYALS